MGTGGTPALWSPAKGGLLFRASPPNMAILADRCLCLGLSALAQCFGLADQPLAVSVRKLRVIFGLVTVGCMRYEMLRATNNRSVLDESCLMTDVFTSGITHRPSEMGCGLWVGVMKRSTISTGQLKAFRPLHLPPINHVVYMGSLTSRTRAILISRGASYLDAFSSYPCRT